MPRDHEAVPLAAGGSAGVLATPPRWEARFRRPWQGVRYEEANWRNEHPLMTPDAGVVKRFCRQFWATKQQPCAHHKSQLTSR